MRKIRKADATGIYQGLHTGECVRECFAQVFDGSAYQLTARRAPGLNNSGVEASPATECPDPAVPAFSPDRDPAEVLLVRVPDMADIVLFHADHDRAGGDVAVSHDRIVCIPGPTPQEAVPPMQEIFHGIDEGIPAQDPPVCSISSTHAVMSARIPGL